VSTAPPPEPPFEALGDYEVLARISEGGMASVWLGRSKVPPERFVALKVIRAEYGRNKDFVAMFVDESSIASRLVHPNIVSIVDVGYDGKRHYLAMEVLRGHTLLALWKAAHAKGKRLPYEVVAWMGARLADALHYAHDLADDQGAPIHLVHRDVNPSNIFVTREGVPKLIDFGLAKVRDRIASTAIGVVKGKLAYLAPEQAHGQPADRRSDVFALGVTLWEVSLDRRLFLDDTDVQTIRRVRETQIPDPISLDARFPRPLADAIQRALAKEPKERWQTAAELRDALDAFVAGVGREVGAADVRALLADVLGNDPVPEWDRWVDEVASEKEKTRVWEGALPPESTGGPSAADSNAAGPAVARPLGPPPRLPPRAGPVPARLLAVAGGCAGAGAIVMGILVRSCRGTTRVEALERRVARIEEVLSLDDAGPAPTAPLASDAGGEGVAAVPADDRGGPCAIAKVATYRAWQEAVAKAKTNAGAAEAACSSLWRESRRQACYYAATSTVRAAQTARDAIIEGGNPAREAVRNVKDDPKNEAIARARSLSETAFVACDDDGGS